MDHIMSPEEQPMGTIDIAPAAIESIASHAINQCYGVVGMAGKNLFNDLAQRLSREAHRGIEVAVAEDGITIDAYVIIQYGTRIKAVAETIQSTVKFQVEKSIGMPVKTVNVYVQGLRRHDK
jgi:uncharacterized alkaline shock family protein YloU